MQLELKNTAYQLEFFRALAAGKIEKLREIAAGTPDVLHSYDYRNFGATPLTAACFSNRLDLVRELIELGADPNQKSDWSMGPWSPLHCAIFRQDKAMAEYLLSRGATMDVHTAAGLGKCDAVASLLDANPSRVIERGGDGCHPLHFADTTEVAQLLLNRGAEIDGRCLDHFSTPVQYLSSVRPEVATFLLSHGATPDIFSAVLCGNVSCMERLLNDNPDLIHARVNQTFFPPGKEHNVHNILTFVVGQDATPLHAAAKSNQHEAVSLLIQRGMMPNIRGGYDQATPLHTAAWNNCSVSIGALLDHGADIDIRSGKIHNNTPAGWAIVAGSDIAFELLMDRGAQCHPWFLEDAREACNGLFDQISRVQPEQRQRILSRLSG